ncbi:reverse transcriptase domain-containing protein [Tanacetum coccineum]
MAPKRATRSTPVTENPTTTTVTNAQLQAMIDQGVTAALAARDANRNGDDSHTFGNGSSTCGISQLRKIVGHDVAFVANETEKVDKYISGLPNNIYGNVKQSDNKRKADDSSRNNHGHQQQPFKRKNVTRVYNMGTGEKKPYGGSLPKCTKCHFHHNGPCTQKCHKFNKVGHFARDYRSSGNTNVANTQKGNRANPKGNGCFECGAPGHFKRDCPKLKNKDGGNGNAQGWVYAVGNAEKKGMHRGTRTPMSSWVRSS